MGRRLFRTESLKRDGECRNKASEGRKDVADLEHLITVAESPHPGPGGRTGLLRVGLHRSW